MTGGIVKWFNTQKGYGFITLNDGGNDVFVHHSNIVKKGDEFANLDEGDEVEFEEVQGEKGLEARNVVVKKNASPKRREHSNRGFGSARDGGGYGKVSETYKRPHL